MKATNTNDFEARGDNPKALFSLKLYRGDGMLLLAMNWKSGKPPENFVGFAIEYMEPGGDRFFALKNRITFPDANGKVKRQSLSTLLAPIQKFRWVHFPRNAEMKGDFVYKVKPVFMNEQDELSYGEAQQAAIQLNRETYARKLNVTFTRGFISSQAFVDKYEKDGGVKALLPGKSKDGLDFEPTHPQAEEALAWMGFEARSIIYEVLDKAISDKKALVRVVAYDLNEPGIVSRLEKLGKRVKVIIDDSAEHGEEHSAETQAAERLQLTTKGGVKRQNMGQLQHNKTIVVDGPKIKVAICGSTNFTWRGLYVQANNAFAVYGAKAIAPFMQAFDDYWNFDKVKDFGNSASAVWTELGLTGIDAKVSFSPHIAGNLLLDDIAADMAKTKSSLFYSLAFLHQTPGVIRDTIQDLMDNEKMFVYGISDKKNGGLVVHKPDGTAAPVYPSEISKSMPEPFKSEPTGGMGNRMHHKFVVIDFDKPTARVYLGSYNFSNTADTKNGENLVLVKDRKIAVAYMIEALRIFDHYHFRVAAKEAKAKKKVIALKKPPRKAGEKAWWEEDYTNKRKIKDREMFGK